MDLSSIDCMLHDGPGPTGPGRGACVAGPACTGVSARSRPMTRRARPLSGRGGRVATPPFPRRAPPVSRRPSTRGSRGGGILPGARPPSVPRPIRRSRLGTGPPVDAWPDRPGSASRASRRDARPRHPRASPGRSVQRARGFGPEPPHRPRRAPDRVTTSAAGRATARTARSRSRALEIDRCGLLLHASPSIGGAGSCFQTSPDAARTKKPRNLGRGVDFVRLMRSMARLVRRARAMGRTMKSFLDHYRESSMIGATLAFRRNAAGRRDEEGLPE